MSMFGLGRRDSVSIKAKFQRSGYLHKLPMSKCVEFARADSQRSARGRSPRATPRAVGPPSRDSE